MPWLLDWAIVNRAALNKAFDVALHLGTLIGALVYFRRDVARYLAAWIRSIRARRISTVDERLAWALVIGTIPGAIAGASLESVVEDKLGQPVIIAAMLAVFGAVLYVVDRAVGERHGLEELSVRGGLVLGIAQALALQPGVSRSGITITAARAMGFTREAAARFSFLLSLPVIAGAGALKGFDLARTGMPQGMAGPFVWGIASSAVSGFLVIAFLLSYLRRHGFAVFMWYRLAVAALVIGLVAAGARPATV